MNPLSAGGSAVAAFAAAGVAIVNPDTGSISGSGSANRGGLALTTTE